MIDGEPNGPGSTVSLPASEAAFLQSRGFLQDQPPILAQAVPGSNPAAIGLQNAQVSAQGPQYRR